jgi:hypothetical protein
MHKKIRNRDLGEQAGAIVGIPLFVYFAYQSPFLLTKVTSVLIILWDIFVIIRVRSARKHKPGAFTASYLEYLYKTRDYLNTQKQLLDSVLYWYILPAMTLVFLFILGPGIAGRVPKIIKGGAGNVVFAIVIYFLNKRAVKKEFMPRLKKIDELITVTEKSS